MMSQKEIFQSTPAVSSSGQTTALSNDTNCGLFLAKSGNRYLVFDDVKKRCALTLSHAEIDPFTVIKLKKSPLEMGSWLPLGFIRLDRLSDYESKALYTGTLCIREGAANMLVTDGGDRFAVKKIAMGTGGRTDWEYDRWTLFAEGGLEFFRFRTGKHPPFILFE